MKYRPEIDGLRALAVTPVILFHAGLGPFRGGFIGVDIFFVISGYLITTLLIEEIERGSFSLLDFYERRARRILPALFLVMAACIPFAYLWMFPLELNDFFQSVFATTIFSSNILFWLESGYFETASELKPLLHTWSLAIEEQYYILFPLLLFVLWRGPARLKRSLVHLGWIALASLFLAIWGTEFWPSANFYLLPARAWELLIGALCAVLLWHFGAVKPKDLLAAFGICMILAGLLWSSDKLWPSWMTLLPVLGTGFVILFSTSSHGVGRLLASPPMVGIGLISYSAYLWHQPLLAFARLRLPDEPSIWIYSILVVATFVLAYLSWRFVERPFRKGGGKFSSLSRRGVFWASGIVGSVFMALALLGDATDGFPDRLAPSGRGFAQIVDTVAGGRTVPLPCDTDIAFLPVNKEPLDICVFSAPLDASNGKRAILIGDSHATVMSEEIKDLLLAHGYDIAIMSFGGCIPFPGYNLVGRNCHSANEAVYDHIDANSYDIVIIASRPQFVIGEDIEVRFREPDSSEHVDQVLSLMDAGLQRLLGPDRTVIVVEPVPEMPVDIGQFVRKSYAFQPNLSEISFDNPYDAYLERAGDILALLDNISDKSLVRIRTAEILCDNENATCPGIEDGVALYTDDNHLSKHGIQIVLPEIEAALGQIPSK